MSCTWNICFEMTGENSFERM